MRRGDTCFLRKALFLVHVYGYNHFVLYIVYHVKFLLYYYMHVLIN